MLSLLDCRGVPVSTENRELLDRLEAAHEDSLGFAGDPVAAIDQVLAEHPDFVMGHCLKAGLLTQAMETRIYDDMLAGVVAAEALEAKANHRERGHMAALRAWVDGDFHGAVEHWGSVLVEYPRDLLALQLVHLSDVLLGHTVDQRDCVARVLPFWDEGVPGFGYVLGFYAFGLEECRDFSRAEELGRRAVALNPKDAYAIHAVAHVMEMQGRLREGIDWIGGLEKSWNACNNFRYHVWWHRALFHLELGEHDAVLTLYDNEIRADQTDDYLDMSNGIALLWRLEDAGVDVGDRWEELADKSEARVEGRVLAFADAHYMMALAATGRQEPANRMLASMRQFADGRDDTQASVTGKAGMPLAQAILAYRAGEYRKAAELLLPVRYDIRRLGGSNAQRDVFAQILVQAAVKAGRLSLARALLSERTAAMPNRPSAWALQAQVQEKLGDADAAAASRKRADQAARG